MDKETISNHLNEITNEEVPNVNLLPKIQQQLKQQSRPTTGAVFTLARVASVIVVLLTASMMIGYAIIQSNLLPTTIPQDLITELQMEETVDGITLNLNWAYADANHIALEVNTSYDATEAALGDMLDMSLQTADGINIPTAFGGGGGGGAGGNGDTSIIIDRAFMWRYDASAIPAPEDTIDLIFTVTFGYQEAPQMPAGSGGGGGGGGGGQPPAQANVVPDSDALDRTYTFEFTVPMLPARTATIEAEAQTMGASGVTIQNISVTPSTTVFEMCTPLFGEGWFPRVYIQTNEPLPEYMNNAMSTVLLDGQQVYAGSAYQAQPVEGLSDCRQLAIHAPFHTDSTQMTLIVDEFFRPRDVDTIDHIEADIAHFAELGFILTYEIVEPPVRQSDSTQAVIPMSPDEILILTLEQHPETMTHNQALGYVSGRMLNERLDADLILTLIVD